jgi:hypothetical protein
MFTATELENINQLTRDSGPSMKLTGAPRPTWGIVSLRQTLDSISSRFNVLNTPISATAPIDAKTHVWPVDGIAQCLTNQRSLLGHIQAKTWDVIWLAAGY